jgi:hypothetical protein
MSEPTPEDWDIAFEIMTNDPRAGDIARTRAEVRDQCRAFALDRARVMAANLDARDDCIRRLEGQAIWNAWTAVMMMWWVWELGERP